MSRSIRDSIPLGLADIPTIHSVWGTFDSKQIEDEFREDDFKIAIRRYIRFSVPLSVIAFLAYGLHDAIVIPEVRNAAWMIRYGVFAPIGLLLVLFVLKNEKPARHQPAMLIFGLTVNLVVMWIGAISPAAGFFIYTGYALVFLTIGPFLARMNVKTQLAYGVLTLALYNALDLVAHAEPYVRVSMNIAVLTLGTIGVLAARQSELQARLQFLQRKVIQTQMSALDAERTKSESLLLNVLPRRIAERLKESPGVIADRFESATVLFSDVVGFTRLSASLEPDELVRRLDAIFSKFDELAGQLGLEKIKTIGDAYMVAGGIPVQRDGHVEAVCEMAMRMRDCLAAIDPEVEIRIGVHTGPVVAGVIGTKKFIYDVWGDTVNTASRMESHGVPGKIHVSEAIHEAVGHLFDLECRGEIAVKGKGNMTTYLLHARRALETEREASLPSVRPAH